MSRDGLFKVLGKMGCPPKLLSAIHAVVSWGYEGSCTVWWIFTGGVQHSQSINRPTWWTVHRLDTLESWAQWYSADWHGRHKIWLEGTHSGLVVGHPLKSKASSGACMIPSNCSKLRLHYLQFHCVREQFQRKVSKLFKLEKYLAQLLGLASELYIALAMD